MARLVQDSRPPGYYGLGLAIGGLYVRLFDLVQAYGILASDGIDYQLSLFKKRVLHKKGKRFIPADISRMITLFLSDPLARLPTFPRMGALEYPFAVALKTGTSQGYRDAWIAAYTPKYLIGVWTGNGDNTKMDKLSGGGSSGILLRSIMKILHPDEMKGLKDVKYRPPEKYIARQISRISGRLASETSLYTTTEYFKPGTEPVKKSHIFRKVVIDTRNGLRAGATCPAEYRATRMFAFLPARFSDWARKSGIELAPVEQDRLAANKPQQLGKYKVTVFEPVSDSKLYINPALPASLQTIALRVNIEPPIGQAVWYVDGRPFKVVDYPYTTRWPLKAGTHEFQVKFPYAGIQSSKVSIIVD